jgi:hypothetical protein
MHVYLTTFLLLDVHQFTIITELLGTPPDDVIATICSENVKRKKKVNYNIDFIYFVDTSICKEFAKT